MFKEVNVGAEKFGGLKLKSTSPGAAWIVGATQMNSARNKTTENLPRTICWILISISSDALWFSK
jgi:hypothetical protein